MISRLIAALFAVAFMALVLAAGADPQPRRRKQLALAWCSLALLVVVPIAVFAAPLPEGARVRIESEYIESGWHEGTLRRAQNRCWMVQLEHATQSGYTLLSLTTAKRLQIARNGQWQDASPAENLTDQPRECLEEGSD
jgi:hypothetical protein